MSYQALYRVWRPQTFDELVGQTMIAETLKNAIKNNQLSHAYLFTGPRGTGKTSAAKILAKAVNCPHQHDGNPCNECDLCQAITKGQLSDVIEIDAASNNGVEEIRDLRDKVRYAPNEARYKVYIIDEVHMLTTGAFNALLKTLEEPPAQVLFILATTEPHKIPATIISRTQRFDFQRISLPDLIGRMAYILDTDGIAYEPDALSVIGRAANGGMRDSLSLLDQALSYNAKQVTVQSALEVTGSLSQLTYIDYMIALNAGNGEAALQVLQAALQSGKQAGRFVEELILFCRDMLLTLHTQQNFTLLHEAELEAIQTQVPGDFYYRLIQQLNEVQNQMRFATQADLFVEVMTIQMAQPLVELTDRQSVDNPSVIQTIERLEQQIQQLEQQVQALQNVKTVMTNPAEPRVPRERPQAIHRAYQQDTNAIYAVLNEATHSDIEQLRQGWDEWLAELTPSLRVRLTGSHVQAAGPNRILLAFESAEFCGNTQQDLAFVAELEQDLANYFERPVGLAFVLQSEWRVVRQNYKVLRDQAGGPVVLDAVQPVTQPSALSKNEAEATPVAVDVFAIPVESEPATGGEDFEQVVLPSVDPAFEMLADPATPAIVEQAFALFGEENVEVYYDK